MKANKNNSKRATVKKYLNRTKIYRLSDYVRNCRKATGRHVSESEVKSCLKHMSNEGQIEYTLLEGPNGATYVVGQLIGNALRKVA